MSFLAPLLGLVGSLRDEAATLEQIDGWLSFYDETFWWIEWCRAWLAFWSSVLQMWAEVLDLFWDPFGMRKEASR